MMSFNLSWRGLCVALIAMVMACSPDDPNAVSHLEPPSSVTATPLSLTSVRLDWVAPDGADLQLFRIERRENLRGDFRLLAEVDPEITSYFDAGLTAGTFYGYRIRTVDRVGERSRASTVAGALTPPPPGIVLQASLQATPPGVEDQNGYRVVITGAKDTTVTLGAVDQVILSPLPAGSYTLHVTDVVGTCRILGDTIRTAEVADTGLATRTPVSFAATCTDPTRGTIVALVEVEGDSVDVDGYRVEYAGIIPGSSTPVVGTATVNGAGESRTFFDLPPGSYEVSLTDVELPCSVDGVASNEFDLGAGGVDTVTFRVTCPNKGGGGDPDAPYVFRSTWSPQQGGSGSTVTLDISLDLSANGGTQQAGAVQAALHYNPAVLGYLTGVAPEPSKMNNLTVNAGTPGLIRWGNFTTSATAPSGIIPVARFTFTVNGSTGQQAPTRSDELLISDGDFAETLEHLFRVVEDTFTVGTGGGGANQSPTAQAGGPYSGAAGSPIAFSSAGSNDPDGTIASYAWSFSDGTSSTVANPSKSFSSAGGFSATLTVTDNQGATGTDQASITVTSGGGGSNQSPVAEAGGPYTGQPGQGVSFSSAGSIDPDGTIASYAWSFSDGTSSTAASPSKSFASAGNYTATLTVTDNQGAIGTDQASVTIAAPAGGVTWTSAFGAFESVLGTFPMSITLGLPQDIPQTTGSPEAVQSYTVDSLVWDSAVIEYHSLTYASGGGSINPTNATGGCKCKLIFTGVGLSPNTGNVPIATVRFVPKGATGSSTTPRFYISTVLSTPALGTFNYRGLMQLAEGSLTLP